MVLNKLLKRLQPEMKASSGQELNVRNLFSGNQPPKLTLADLEILRALGECHHVGWVRAQVVAGAWLLHAAVELETASQRSDSRRPPTLQLTAYYAKGLPLCI